jgi:hypothetical protein
MEVSDTGWNGHQWHEANPRRLRVGAGTPVLHRHCVRCGRDFLTDLTSRRSRAVCVCAISFYQLDEIVTERWLREACPGTHLLSDDDDRKKKIAEFLVSDDPLVR